MNTDTLDTLPDFGQNLFKESFDQIIALSESIEQFHALLKSRAKSKGLLRNIENTLEESNSIRRYITKLHTVKDAQLSEGQDSDGNTIINVHTTSSKGKPKTIELPSTFFTAEYMRQEMLPLAKLCRDIYHSVDGDTLIFTNDERWQAKETYKECAKTFIEVGFGTFHDDINDIPATVPLKYFDKLNSEQAQQAIGYMQSITETCVEGEFGQVDVKDALNTFLSNLKGLQKINAAAGFCNIAEQHVVARGIEDYVDDDYLLRFDHLLSRDLSKEGVHRSIGSWSVHASDVLDTETHNAIVDVLCDLEDSLDIDSGALRGTKLSFNKELMRDVFYDLTQHRDKQKWETFPGLAIPWSYAHTWDIEITDRLGEENILEYAGNRLAASATSFEAKVKEMKKGQFKEKFKNLPDEELLNEWWKMAYKNNYPVSEPNEEIMDHIRFFKGISTKSSKTQKQVDRATNIIFDVVAHNGCLEVITELYKKWNRQATDDQYQQSAVKAFLRDKKSPTEVTKIALKELEKIRSKIPDRYKGGSTAKGFGSFNASLTNVEFNPVVYDAVLNDRHYA